MIRHNKGKPELSYLLEFRKSLKMLKREDLPIFSITNHFKCIEDILYCLEMDLGTIYVQHSDDVIVTYPEALEELCKVCYNGALKYERESWKQGYPKNELIDSALRHYFKWIKGSHYDVLDEQTLNRQDLINHFDGDLEKFREQFATHHLAHMIWNLLVLLELYYD